MCQVFGTCLDERCTARLHSYCFKRKERMQQMKKAIAVEQKQSNELKIFARISGTLKKDPRRPGLLPKNGTDAE